MNRDILLLSKALSENELVLLERALENFNPGYLENNQHGQQIKADLQEKLMMARGWAHHIDRTDRCQD